MKFRWEKKYLYWGITGFLVIVCSIAFFKLIDRFDVVAGGLQTLAQILMPFTLAFAFAYLLNPIVKFIEKNWSVPLYNFILEKQALHPRKPRKGKVLDTVKQSKFKAFPRVVSILLALSFAIFVVASLLVMVLPQLAKSIMGIANSLPEYLNNFEHWVIQLVESNTGLKEMLSSELGNISQGILDWAKTNLLPQLNNIVSGITAGVFGAVGAVADLLIGIIISVYVLFSKEKFAAQAKKVIYTIFPVRTGNVILKTSRRADRVFGGFIIGKLIDSAIIGVLCFVCMSIFNLISPLDMPFVLLISTIIGITNIIPFFGPFIGAIPSILLIMLVSPLASLYFAIFVLLLQQFDGNILGPKILGNSTGLSAFWVMFAILLGGGLFGFTGMLLGVPSFAVIYTIISELMSASLKKRKLPVKTEEYYSVSEMEEADEGIANDTGSV